MFDDDNDNDKSGDYEEEYDEFTFFNHKDCTCDHEWEDHNYSTGCTVIGCDCDAIWED